MVRFVRDKNGDVIADKKFKLPGRGVYVCPRRPCLDQALKKQRFQKSLKANVNVSDFLGEFDLGGLVDAEDQSV